MTFTKEMHRERKASLVEMLGGRCIDCGTEELLEFDHKDPTTKVHNVVNLLSSWSRAVEEAKKCVLRCKSCHDKKTYGEARSKWTHGTYRMYSSGRCRCAECKEANAEYMRQYRSR